MIIEGGCWKYAQCMINPQPQWKPIKTQSQTYFTAKPNSTLCGKACRIINLTAAFNTGSFAYVFARLLNLVLCA